MVIWTWCKLLTPFSGVKFKFSKNHGSERNLAGAFRIHIATPPSNIGPFGPPSPSPQGPKNFKNGAFQLKIAIYRPFFSKMDSTFFWASNSVYICLMQKKIEIQKFLFLRLEFIVFFVSGAPLKNFTRQKNSFQKTKVVVLTWTPHAQKSLF